MPSRILVLPWLVWLSRLGIIPQTERLPVEFPVKAHVWVLGQVPGWGQARRNRYIFLSFLPPFLSLKINTIFKNTLVLWTHFGNCEDHWDIKQWKVACHWNFWEYLVNTSGFADLVKEAAPLVAINHCLYISIKDCVPKIKKEVLNKVLKVTLSLEPLPC